MKKRRAHFVKPNENSETLHTCIFMDCETDETSLSQGRTGHILRFGWACLTRRNPRGDWTKPIWKRFTDYSDFWLWVSQATRKRVKTWVWCHNGSFDYPVLHAFTHLPDIGWHLESAILDAPPLVVRYMCERKSLVLCDTLNIWRMSLAEMGKKVGLPKLEIPKRWGDQERDDEYCIRDVEIIRKAVIDWTDFLRDNDLGGFCPTIAAQSMRTFRHRYLDDRILIEDNHFTLELARSCYHGGRCEAGFIGHITQPVYYIDVNSMYPFVMSYCEMPLRLKAISRFVQIANLPRLLNEYCVCAHVRLETSEPFAAIVRNHKLVFPVGKFDAHLTTPEIKYALEAGFLREVHLCAFYEKGIPFRKFALELYANKEQASRAGRKLDADHWKKLLNSFYGKWGQNGRKYLEIGHCDPELFYTRPHIDAQSRKVTMRRYFGGIVSEMQDDGESGESHPAIAAHITSEARMILWTLIRQLSTQDYFYCDTDGLLVSETGFHQFHDRLDDYRLGFLKHAETFSDVWIYGCKDLLLDGEEKIKGISKRADRLDQGVYSQIKWSGLKGLLAADSIDMPITVPITKTLSRTYTKGTVLPSGFVRPLHLEEW